MSLNLLKNSISLVDSKPIDNFNNSNERDVIRNNVKPLKKSYFAPKTQNMSAREQQNKNKAKLNTKILKRLSSESHVLKESDLKKVIERAHGVSMEKTTKSKPETESIFTEDDFAMLDEYLASMS